jgi:4-amino-4-deoxy-L-arabinose transferase-like glycosyltransferase
MGNVSRAVVLVLLIVCSAAVYLLGNGSVALWDRDEPRYAQTSRQMLQSGDWVVPHLLDKTRTAKPPLIYWCEAAAMRVFGDNNFAARFPSAIAIILLLIVLSIVLWKPLGSQLTLWTVFIFATSGLTIAAAKMCITDALLLLWVTIGQICLYAMWRGNRSWPMVLVLAVAIGLAFLAKFPVILGIQATTLLALLLIEWLCRQYPSNHPDAGSEVPRRAGALASEAVPAESLTDRSAGPHSVRITIAKWVTGLLIVAAIFLPWVLLVNYRSKDFIHKAVGHEVWDRMMTPLEQHVGPPGYYFLTIWLTYFPWSLMLPMAIGVAIRNRADPRMRFALAAILGPWILLECVRTKLPHYLLPVFPPLAFLTADAMVRCLKNQMSDLKSRPFIIATGIWAGLVAVAASGTWLVIKAPLPMPIHAMTALSILGPVFGLTVFIAFKTSRIAFGATAMGLGTFAFVSVMYLWYLPNATFLRLAPRLANVLIQNHVTEPKQALMLEYMEPGLAFAQGGTIREAGDLGFSKHFEPQLTPWLVLPESVWDKAPASLRDDYEIKAKEFGLNYADHGKWMTVLVLHHKGS